MRTIDMQTWARREHFRKFIAFDHPHFGLCANVNLSKFHPAVKQSGFSITVAIVYVIARAANAVPEFRYRIHGEDVVEHEIVHPSATILVKDDLFSFCTFEYLEDFSLFSTRAVKQIATVQDHPTLENKSDEDNLLYMSIIPWVSFTDFTHPMHLQPADSVPRFAWGRFFEDADGLKMPLNVQGHHALMDGIHIGKFYAELQGYLDQPEIILG